jgi:hypothetical protein
MDETGSHQLLHFFHSSAWCLDAVVVHWSHLTFAYLCQGGQRRRETVSGP